MQTAINAQYHYNNKTESLQLEGPVLTAGTKGVMSVMFS